MKATGITETTRNMGDSLPLWCKSMMILILVFVSISDTIGQSSISAYFPDIKIVESNGPAPGHFFIAAKGVTAPGAQLYIAIVDNWGTPLFFRLMPKASVSMRLLNDGTIGYAHGVPRRLYIMDEMLNVTHTLNTQGFNMDAHDWVIDHEGNYNRILFAQYTRVVDMSLLITGGNPAAVVDESIIQEFDKDMNLLSSWRTEDNFNILDGNENSPFVDFLSNSLDYAHLNSVAIYSDTSMVISTRHMDEITNIDRRTGEIIWRLGGKNNQFTFINDTIGFSHQHCPRRLENGNLLIFDNGNLHIPQRSSAVEYSLDEVNMTATLVKRYYRFPDAFAPRDGATQRLDNGNTIITWGPAWPSMTEFHPDGSVAVEFDFTEHSLSPRIEKYFWKTKVFETSVDTIDFGLWDGPGAKGRIISIKNNTDTIMHITGYSVRGSGFTVSTPLPLQLLPHADTDIEILFDPSASTTGYLTDVITLSSDNLTQRIARQVTLFGRKTDNTAPGVIIMPDTLNVPVNATITMTFTEAVRRADGVELDFNNVDNLIILKRDGPGGPAVVMQAKINSEKKLITINPTMNLDSGTTYYVSFTDQIEDYSGNSLPASSVTFKTEGIATSGEKLYSSQILSVYPNPGSGLFRVKTRYEGAVEVNVYSLAGIRVEKSMVIEGSDFEIDLRKLNTGLYILHLKTRDGRTIGTSKIVVKK